MGRKAKEKPHEEFVDAMVIYQTGTIINVYGVIGNGSNMKLKSLLPLGLAGALATGAFAGEPRGIRNNNPGNIRKSSIEWKGASGNDGTFVKFATPEDGIRAIARVLKVYDSKYKINTPAGIIGRWAPSSENFTDKYIDFVAKKLNKKPTERIDVNNDNELAKIIKAIIEYENGKVPYDDATILRGIKKL